VSFCYAVLAQLLLTRQRQYVLQQGGTKSMTGKRAEGMAAGRLASM